MDAEETNIYHAILISALIIGIIIVYFIISITRHQRKNLELHRLNILTEITALEKERGRIASDLHDELGPVLSAIKMKINSFELVDKTDQIQILKTNDHIDELLKRIRDISFDLMPNSLLRKGLITAVKEFVSFLNNNNNTLFIFECKSDFQVHEQKAINIYRIVQETTHNTIKHAQATECCIEIKLVQSIFKMTIRDNGKGFDYEKEKLNNTGFGLRGLLSRTEVAGGVMYLESIPGKGTIYNFEIPI
jgi:signal transduction histidine kinase